MSMIPFNQLPAAQPQQQTLYTLIQSDYDLVGQQAIQLLNLL